MQMKFVSLKFNSLIKIFRIYLSTIIMCFFLLSVIKSGMLSCIRYCIVLLTPSVTTCHLWTILPFVEVNWRFPIATWYPFSTENSIVFAIVYFYQYVGIIISAVINTAQDTIISAFIAQTNGQVKRLGIKLSKVLNKNVKKFLKIS